MRHLLLAALLMGFIGSGPAWAEDPPPFPDFTFKKGKPPKKGTRKLITVQIDPAEQITRQPAAQTETPAVPAAKAAYAWYWTKVPTALSEDTAKRLRLAISTLGDGPGGAKVAGPRLQTLQDIAHAHGADILRATIGTDVSPALVLAVISVESGGNASAVSGAGAEGLMQLIPATADRFGVNDSFSAPQNIKGGVAYLDWLMKEFQGDAVMALAGYNAGENAVKKHEGVPPFAETRDYVPKVLAAFEVASGLCKTRPELITDACALSLASN